MLNLIKADFFRISKNRMLQITALVLLAFIVNAVMEQTIFFSMASTSDSTLLDVQIQYYKDILWTGSVAIQAMTSASSVLLFFALPFFIVIIGKEMHKKTYINILSQRKNRASYFGTKLLTLNLCLVLLYGLYYGLVFGIGSILHGVGEFDWPTILLVVKIISLQLICHICWMSIWFAFIISTEQYILSLVGYLILPFVFFIIGSVLPLMNGFSIIYLLDNLNFLKDYIASQEVLVFSVIAIFLVGIGMLGFNNKDLR